jgi:hypothetical protein
MDLLRRPRIGTDFIIGKETYWGDVNFVRRREHAERATEDRICD